MRWTAWTAAVAGVWLIIAPFALGYSMRSAVATTEAVIVGLLIGGLAVRAALAAAPAAYLDYALMALGGWSVAAPFLLGYAGALELARNSDVVAGLLVVALATFHRVWVTPGAGRKVTA